MLCVGMMTELNFHEKDKKDLNENNNMKYFFRFTVGFVYNI